MPTLPSFRSYPPEVIEYARYLGMNILADRELLWIAQEGLDAPLPSGWREFSDSQGTPYFYNSATGESSWSHPTDAHYWGLYRRMRAQKQKTQETTTLPKPPSTASSSTRPFVSSTRQNGRVSTSCARAHTPRVPRTPRADRSRSRPPASDASPQKLRAAPHRPSTAECAPRASPRNGRPPQSSGYISGMLGLAAGRNKSTVRTHKEGRQYEPIHLDTDMILSSSPSKARAPVEADTKDYPRPLSKVERESILNTATLEPVGGPAHLKATVLTKTDFISRPQHSLIWCPPKQKSFVVPEYRPKRRVVRHTGRPEREELEEIERVAEEIGVAKVQLSTLYKAFKRHTADSELFTSEEWGHILSLIGVSRSDVRQRMFEVWSTKTSRSIKYLKFKDAVKALCALGVGGRKSQAEAIFKLCDLDDNAKLSRAEVLSFAQDQHPLGSHLPRQDKSVLFVEVGKLFSELGAVSSKEEVSFELFVEAAVESDVAWEHIGQINPYRHYFTQWDDETSGIQNLLNALFLQADAQEHKATVQDRVYALGQAMDTSGDGHIDEDEILAALMTLGYKSDEAEAMAKEQCGLTGMTLESFMQIFSRIAEADIKQFAKIEKAYGMHRTEQEKLAMIRKATGLL